METKNKHRSISTIGFISSSYLQLQYQKIELFVSKYGNTDFEDNSISFAHDKRLSTSRNLINHQPSFDNFEASISHNNCAQISRQENFDNKNDDIQSILESFNEEAPSEYFHNCIRWQNRTLFESYENDSPHFIPFSTHYTSHVHRRRKFNFYHQLQMNQMQKKLQCYKCSHHLVTENDYKTANKNQFLWSAFIWYLLKDNGIQREYGEQIWSFTPHE